MCLLVVLVEQNVAILALLQRKANNMNDDPLVQPPTDPLTPSVSQETVRLNFDQIMSSNEDTKPKRKPKKRKSNLLLNVFIWIVVALVIIALGLIISAFIAGFNSVFEMIDWILAQITDLYS